MVYYPIMSASKVSHQSNPDTELPDPLPRTLTQFLRYYWAEAVHAVLVISYIVYMIPLTINRMYTLSTNYFDLGIMHQTVFNTYRAITTLDPSLVLQLTDPHGVEQIYRPAIHNDIILALLAPFYFIHSGPETLLVIQTIVLALGADLLFLIVRHLFRSYRGWPILALTVSVVYLIYPAMNLTNKFDFHGVALATTLILGVAYFWLTKRYGWTLLFAVLAMITKEQVGLTIAMMGLLGLGYSFYRNRQPSWIGATLFAGGIAWFFFSLKVMMPAFRTEGYHFALNYFAAFGDDPLEIITTVLTNPLLVWEQIANLQTATYLYELLLPVGFLPLLAPLVAAVMLPELGIILLSANDNMRNIYFHYTAVLTPVVFLSTIAAAQTLVKRGVSIKAISAVLLATGVFAAATYGPLPFSKERDIHPFTHEQENITIILDWQERLSDESLKIASSNKLAPFFTSRQYFYQMSVHYDRADYVIVDPEEVYNAFGRETAIPGYEKMLEDPRYEQIFDQGGIEVYQRIDPDARSDTR